MIGYMKKSMKHLLNKTLDEIRNEYILTDHVIFEDYRSNFCKRCHFQIERDKLTKKEVLNKLTVGDDVLYILKYFSDGLDYSDVSETSSEYYVGKLKIEFHDVISYIDIYREKNEDDELVEKSWDNVEVIQYQVVAEEAKTNVSDPNILKDELKQVDELIKARKKTFQSV